MGRRPLAVAKRGGETLVIYDAETARAAATAHSGTAAPVEDIISRAHRKCLGMLELANGGKVFSGVGQGVGALRRRLQPEDTATLRRLKGLGEAFGFIRHFTSVGEATFLAEVDLAPKRLDSTPSTTVTTTEEATMEVDRRR